MEKLLDDYDLKVGNVVDLRGLAVDRKRGVVGHGGSLQHWSLIHRSIDCLIFSFHEVFSASRQFQPIRFYFCNQLIGCQERK